MPIASNPEYLEAVTKAMEAAKSYYNGDSTLMDDFAYDQLVRDILEFEKSLPESAKLDHNLHSKVAAGVGSVLGRPHTHRAPMLSLDNVFSSAELRDWCQGRNVAGDAGWSVEVKYDGLSLAITYQDGRLTSLATRGDGLVGEDVTYALDRIINIPRELPKGIDIEVRGEVLFTTPDFEEANELRVASGKSKYVNARNAASGALRAETLDYPVKLSFFAHGQVGLTTDSHSEALNGLRKLGFSTGVSGFEPGLFSSIDETVKFIEDIEVNRSKLPFTIDGAVVKLDSFETQKKLGFSSRAPKWGIAVKFTPEEAFGVIESIDLQVGRLGTITPVARLKGKVLVGGANIENVTLHNFDEILRKDIRVGDTVTVRRAGDVIPEIVGVVLNLRVDESIPYKNPSVCPRCGSSIDTSEVRWKCTRGRECGLVESLSYATSRDVLDIDGCGEKVIKSLVDAKLVYDLSDLFKLDFDKVANLDRMGELSASNLRKAILEGKTRPFHKVLTALGVRMTGRSMSKRLANHFGSMERLQSATIEELSAVEGVGPERAQAIKSDLQELHPLIIKLKELGLNMVSESKDVTNSGNLPLSGKSVVITGNLGDLSREEGKDAVERLGGKVSSSVSSKTSLLIIGDAPGSSKVKKAEELGISTLSGSDFLKLLTDK